MKLGPRNGQSTTQSVIALVSKCMASVALALVAVGSMIGMFVLRGQFVKVGVLAVLAILASWATIQVALRAANVTAAFVVNRSDALVKNQGIRFVQRSYDAEGATTFSCTRERMDSLLEDQQLRDILRWIPVGIVYFSPGRTVRFCNPAFCKLYGYEESELLGHAAPLPEDRKEEWMALQEELRQGKQFCNRATVRTRKDGTSFRAFISGVPILDDHHELAGFVGVIVEAENMPIGGIAYEHIMSLAESSSDFLLLLDFSLKIIYANPGFSVATGLDESILQGTNVLDYFPAGEREAIRANFHEAFVSERANYMLKAHIHNTDVRMDIPVRLEFYPVYGSDANTPAAIACILHDLQRETELRDQLRQSEAESQTLFESAPIGIVKVNTLGFPLTSNKKFQEMLGYTEEEVKSQPFSTFVYPDDLKEGRALFLELATGRIDHYEILKRLVRKDGAIIQTTMTVSLVRDTMGAPSHTISMVTFLPDGVPPVENQERPLVQV